MSRIAKIDQHPKYWDRLFANVGQLAMITSVNGEGQVNAATFATCVRVVHEPVHIAFTTSTYKDTYRNIRETGQFVVNLAKFDRAQLEKACILGLTFAPGVNELEKAALTALPSTRVKPPRIEECHRHFECQVVWMKHWVGRVMIVGNALAASVDADCVDERGLSSGRRSGRCNMPAHPTSATSTSRPTSTCSPRPMKQCRYGRRTMVLRSKRTARSSRTRYTSADGAPAAAFPSRRPRECLARRCLVFPRRFFRFVVEIEIADLVIDRARVPHAALAIEEELPHRYFRTRIRIFDDFAGLRV